jgi:hypothetical protein
MDFKTSQRKEMERRGKFENVKNILLYFVKKKFDSVVTFLLSNPSMIFFPSPRMTEEDHVCVLHH